MWWIIGGAGVALGCYILGYVMGYTISNEHRNQAREEMGLEEGCYGCKDVGLPCDPKCKFNSITDEEVNENEQPEENNSETN